jgi:adenosylcobinamide-phosphate synthase
MATMAGALGVVLEKQGAYRLGAGLRLPGAEDITRAVRLMSGAAALTTALVLLAVARRG